MSHNAVRGTIAIIVAIALVGAYQLGKRAGELAERSAKEDAAEAARRDRSVGGGAGLSALPGARERRRGGESPAPSATDARPSVRSIIAQARTRMAGGMMNASGAMRAAALLDQLSDEQIPEALEEIRSIREPQQRMMFATLLLGRWAERDGPAALAYAEEHFGSSNPMMMGIKGSVVSSWAQSDPEGALDWYLEEGKENRHGGMFGSGFSLVGIFGGLAAKDVDLAFERLATLDAPADRQMALQGLAVAIWDDRQREAILDKVAAIEDVSERGVAQNSIVSQWAQLDPEGALAWADSLPEDEGREMARQVGYAMAWSDPRRAGEILLAEARDENDRAQAYSHVMSSWAHSDPEGASEWLASQPQGAELDQARNQLATSLAAGRDPAAAMRWAATIDNDDLRINAVGSVYQMWRGRDQEAADAALDDAGIPEEKVQELRDTEVHDLNSPRAVMFGPGGARAIQEVRVEEHGGEDAEHGAAPALGEGEATTPGATDSGELPPVVPE